MIEQEISPKEARRSGNFGLRGLALVILVSLLFGLAGGVLGALYLARLPLVQKYLPKQILSQNFSQPMFVQEDSGIIDVVKKASPSVVSVIISKDISSIQGFGSSPFDFNFSAPFFQAPTPPQPNNSQPNVQQVGAGSGFFVSPDGLIVTNKHVVSDPQASYTVMTSDGKSYKAKVLAQDSRNDLAIIKIDIKNAAFLDLADSSKLQIGQRVIAIGNSLGEYQNTVTTGIISGIGRSITAGSSDGSEQLEGVIQTDAAINPGNSGGPLLNLSGQVVGINTAIDQQGQLVGFAIPANDIAKALASYKQSGRIIRPFLGVRYVIITQALAEQEHLPKDHGALVLRGSSMTDLAVVPGSPADKAGIVENDIILSVDGAVVDENHTLAGLLKDKNVGDAVTLRIYHKGQEKDVQVVLSEAK